MKINNDLLLEAYFEARKLNLDKDFIQLLQKEINRRGLLNAVCLF
jgi:hypothetical protein